MRVGEIICRSENVPLQEPSFKLPFDRAFIRSSSHSIVGSGDFRQTVIAAPSTACTRRAKKTRKFTIKLYSKLPDEDSRANTRADAFQNWTSTIFACQARKDRIADRAFRVRRRILKINRKGIS